MLLYHSFYIFQDLPEELKNYILCLAVSITILETRPLLQQYLWYAVKLISTFLVQTKQIFGQDVLTANYHNLLHLLDDAAAIGPLHTFSAFHMENFNNKFSRSIRSRKFPLQEFSRRYYEQINVSFFLKERNEIQCKTFLLNHCLVYIV